MSARATQKYGAVVTEDPPLSDDEPARFPPPSSLHDPAALQEALDAHPAPKSVGRATVWLVRAIPILATLSWLGTLLILLFTWLFVDHKIKYKWYLGWMPYLSDVGADNKRVFLVGNILTAVFFVASLAQERLLRAKRVMIEATDERLLWAYVGAVDILIGTTGGIALVLLAIFDAFNYPSEHNLFMSTFIVCVALTGLLQTVEVEHLWHEHPDRHDLRDGTILKWIVLAFSVACGGAFWILYAVCDGDATKAPYPRCYRITTASAILEWAACFGCAFYLATLIVDVWPLHRHSPPTPVVWADRSGIRGLWIQQPQAAPVPVHLPPHISLHRPPWHAGEAARGRSCATVLVQAGGRRGERGAEKDEGDDGYSFAWYSEGKREKRKKRGSG